jgi:hypothetical protein
LTNHIGDLIPDPKNARKHNERNLKQIVDSLQEVGAARSIVIDEDNVILAGNGVTEAAALAGIENVRIIEADGNEIIAVRRSGLTPEQKTRLALWDNRAAELATWDADVLGEMYQEDPAVFDNMFSAFELNNILNEENQIDYKKEWEGMPEFEQDDAGAAKSIKVHFRTLADYELFSELIEQNLTEKTISIWYPEKKPENLKQYRCVDES